ncbi:MAG: hypothetical protein JEZ08_10520 [Clostridiales bacterium]|nr:hypothetical protein [Clostridiales bacterium]
MNHTKDTYKLNLRKNTQKFTIYYTVSDETCINEIAEILENNYSILTKRLNQELEDKINIEIHYEHCQLLKALGFPNAPKWVRGGINSNKILIASPLNPPYGSDSNNVVKTAVHELIHIILRHINDDLPRWLDEGIASFEAKDNNADRIRRTVSSGVQTNSIPTFDDLDTGKDFELFFNRDGYQYSYSIVESIVHNYGYEKLNEFVRMPDHSHEILGVTLMELQNQWINYIKEHY